MDSQISVVNNRLLIPIKVNGKSVYFLVDTGASIALVDITKQKELGFKLGSRLAGTIVGAGGETEDVYHVKNLDVDFNGHKIYQFVATNIDAVKASIKRATDYDIFGILSLKQMQDLGMIIDTASGNVYFKQKEYGL